MKEDYLIICSSKILNPRIYYDFHLKLGNLEAAGALHGYINETFLETQWEFAYYKIGSIARFILNGETPENITIVMANLSQLEFLSGHLNTVINSKWKREIALSIKKKVRVIIDNCAKNLEIERFRPFDVKNYE